MTELFLPAFLEVVRAHPDRTAVEGGGRSLTYAELLDAVRSAAGALAARGVRAGDHVALQLPRSPDFVVGLLAVWWLGAAWAPVGGDWPAARRELVLRELAPRVVLTTIEAGEPVPAHEPLPSDLAYVIYTSGSTGVPKGVRVSHAGLCAVLRDQITAFGLGPSSRVLQVLGHGFDASLSDVGTALLAGAALVVDPGPLTAAHVREALATTRATHADLPPAVLARIDPAQAPPSLACVVVGGEPSAPEVLLAWAARGRVVLVYGPTEATICSSLLVIDTTCTTLGASIGRPIAGFEYALDDGELVIRGPGVALGYVDRPALERARFVNGGYRTGDVVVAGANGTWDFVGRVDRQLKVRGVLVAPEEVEAVLAGHPLVQRAAVVLRDGRLVAFVVGQATASELHEHVAQRLPRALRPQHVESVAELPQHPSGKVDWAHVATLPVSVQDAPFIAPEPGPEARLAAIWSQALGVPVGRDSTFSGLGGDSLAALEIVAAAEAQGIPVTSEALYRGASLAALAAGAPAEPCATSALRADVAIELARLPVPTTRHVQSGSILLTGATGFFGSRVLQELLETTSERIVCVVRADALQRLRAALSHHGATLDESRVELLVGELGRERFGLGEETWARLAETVAVIHHVAAAVNLVLPYARLRDANLVATRNVLTLAATGRVKHVQYASTLSVAACAAPAPSVFHEHDGLDADVVFGGYAASKWAAEELVRRAQLPSVCTVRLGLLTGDSRTGHGSPTCQLVSFLRGLVALGAVVDLAPEQAAALRVDVTPVDYAARAFVGLVTSGHDTVHVASDEPATWTALVGALEAAGARLRRVPVAELRARLGRASLDQTLATTALASCRRVLDTGQRHVMSDLFLASEVRFDTTRTRAAGYLCPPADATLLGLYAREALS